MNEHTYTNPRPEESKAAGTAGYTVADILNRIDRIVSDNEYIYKALESIDGIVMSGGNDMGAGNKAFAVSQVVKSREKTNIELISLLERMYDDIVPRQMPEDIVKFQAIVASLKSLENIDADTLAEMIGTIVHQMFVELPVTRPGIFRNGPQPSQGVNVNIKTPRPPRGPKTPNAAYTAYTTQGGNPFDVADLLRGIADQMSDFRGHIFGGKKAGDADDDDGDEGEED